MSKPPCAWVFGVRRPCKSPACSDWPVCRSHLRVWANANPWEIVKRRPVLLAALRTGNRWADARGLERGAWVELRFHVDGRMASTVIVIVRPDDATAMSDWYLAEGDESSAAKLHKIIHSTAAVDPSRQAELFGSHPT